ncbi:MAG: hypothetical protein LBD28_03190 [Tannerellaceae bacterium]|nr:hypothetical protein [Tannerellaceae bacterium]
MIHTVYLDDTTAEGQRLLKELSRCKEGVSFEKPPVEPSVPEGYMGLEEFRKSAKESLTQILKERGIY